MKEKIISIAKSNTFRQLITYGIVGGVGFIIDFGVFYLLNNHFAVQYPFSHIFSELLNNSLTAETINTNTSHIISSILAITNNFVLNSYFTFKVTDHKVKRFISFFGIAAVGLVISTSLLTFFIQSLGLSGMLGKLIATGIVAVLQFGLNKFFTFKQDKQE